jgi:hypothetical protein
LNPKLRLAMPLISVTTTNPHEPFIAKVADIEYTIVTGVGKQGTQTYVPIEVANTAALFRGPVRPTSAQVPCTPTV